jgi:hypothetical protein
MNSLSPSDHIARCGESNPQKTSDTQRVLALLLDNRGDWVANIYRRTGSMVHSRIADLRRKGHNIECKRFGADDYRYRLV